MFINQDLKPITNLQFGEMKYFGHDYKRMRYAK